MTIWIVLSMIALAATAFTIVPLARSRQNQESGRAAHDQKIYIDQLNEIEREAEQGLISSEAAESARTEIARRLLALENEDAGKAAAPDGPAKFTAAYLAAAIPAAAAGLYLIIGSPHLPGQPASERVAAAERQEETTRLVAQLGEKLRTRSGDLAGWRLYAKGLYSLQRYEEAAAAYRRAASLAPDDPGLYAALAESLIYAAKGSVTAEARGALVETLKHDPANPRARYYAGLAASQAGDVDRALITWISLMADSPADAPWANILERRIEKLAADAGIPADRLAEMRTRANANAAPRGPSQEEMEAAQEMSAEDRSAMIRSMVARLAARMAENPGDAEGWIRLARSYAVLEEHEQSRDAWAKAAALKPGDVETLSAYAAAVTRATPDGAPLPPALIEISEKILKLEPTHGGALWFSGLARAASGDIAGARAHWQKLLTVLDPASPQYAKIKARLDSLPSPEN